MGLANWETEYEVWNKGLEDKSIEFDLGFDDWCEKQIKLFQRS